MVIFFPLRLHLHQFNFQLHLHLHLLLLFNPNSIVSSKPHNNPFKHNNKTKQKNQTNALSYHQHSKTNPLSSSKQVPKNNNLKHMNHCSNDSDPEHSTRLSDKISYHQTQFFVNQFNANVYLQSFSGVHRVQVKPPLQKPLLIHQARKVRVKTNQTTVLLVDEVHRFTKSQ
ncbi:hypothetical protein MTR_8g099370 [Medicago truncatula]|uniref:Transmembrane protein n=1 Tax=Medicago truncatula TaxID=3880 RepID=A0A072TWF1_MEDTR|nr:hypothetical protein MTR_8g099370 [Medicago truncatula]